MIRHFSSLSHSRLGGLCHAVVGDALRNLGLAFLMEAYIAPHIIILVRGQPMHILCSKGGNQTISIRVGQAASKPLSLTTMGHTIISRRNFLEHRLGPSCAIHSSWRRAHDHPT